MNTKKEVLDALKKYVVKYCSFMHEYECDMTSYDTFKWTIETERYNITTELKEYVRWQDPDYYESENVEISFFEVLDENGKDYSNLFTDEEILEAIGYFQQARKVKKQKEV